MSDLSFTIFQNHTLDSKINVVTHYITLNTDGTYSLETSPDKGNAVFFVCEDLTNTRKWITVEVHLTDLNVHGSFMVYEESATKSYNLPPKEKIQKKIKDFITNAQTEIQNLF